MITNGTLQINMNQDGQTRASMPTLESTAFALLYVRQLISQQDNIVNNACNKYKCFIANDEKRDYINELQKSFNKYLDDDLTTMSHYVFLAEHVKNNREFIEAFAYGALIIHGSDKSDLLQKDFAKWIETDIALKPDVFWQETMFTWHPPVQKDKNKTENNAHPVFGKAYDVQISHVK